MSFMIAITGRYGVGKSLLCEHFLALGINEINICDFLVRYLSDHQNGDVWAECLFNQYGHITKKVPFAEDIQIMEYLLQYIQSQQLASCNTVVVLPSFLLIGDWVKKAGFSHIVAVDCLEETQFKYLAEKYNASTASLLVQSSCDRKQYIQNATDVFLNSVNQKHIGWIAGQIINTYKISESY